jgi:hypothetical protein
MRALSRIFSPSPSERVHNRGPNRSRRLASRAPTALVSRPMTSPLRRVLPRGIASRRRKGFGNHRGEIAEGPTDNLMPGSQAGASFSDRARA